MIIGQVRPDGSSTALPAGIHDMAALGDALEITPELEARLKALNLGLDCSDARFKLEVFLRGGPRKGTDVRGVITAWTNGGFLNGGGDQIVYFCPKILDSGNGGSRTCLTPIDVQFATSRIAVCPGCRGVSTPKELVGQIIAEVSTQRWAAVLTRFFYLLGCSADIRMCVSRHSLREASEKELASDRGGEHYAAANSGREWITYPLSRIVKDTAVGATLEKRIKVFLES